MKTLSAGKWVANRDLPNTKYNAHNGGGMIGNRTVKKGDIITVMDSGDDLKKVYFYGVFIFELLHRQTESGFLECFDKLN